MSASAIISRARTSVRSYDIIWLGTLLTIELFLVGLYYGLTESEPTAFRYALYPFVWINLGLWAIVKTRPNPAVGWRHRAIAVGIAAIYFTVLALISGLLGVGSLASDVVDPGARFVMGPPGWGPILAYIGSSVHVTVIPFMTVGYLALAYLVYATVVDATEAALTGVFGLFSCVSCTFPVMASLVAGFVGSTTALTTAIYALSIDLSTFAFVAAVALLYWRPGFR